MLLFRMMKRVFIVLLFVLPFLYGAAEVAAKNYAEKSLAENAKAHDPAATSTSAHVSSPLIWGIARRSTIDEIEISANHVQLGDFLTDDTVATLHGVHIDLAESLRQSEPIIKSIDRLDVSVTISEQQINRLVPSGFSLRFTSGTVELLGPGFVERGTLKPTDRGIAFEPATNRRATIPAIPLSGTLASCIQNVEAGPGAIKVTCSKRNPPTNFPPFPGKATG